MTNAKKTRKKTTKKARSNQSAVKKPWYQRLFWLGLKLALVAIAILIVIGIYLDDRVRQRFDANQMWELPAVVYSRTLTLEPGASYNITQVKQELDALAYSKVRDPQRSGEYSASSSKIEMIRRPFDFIDGPESERHVMISFADGSVQNIVDAESGKQLGFLRIEPKLLGLLESGMDEQRLFLPREQFPEILVDALLATEDRDFYQHGGVSPMAIVRAFAVNLQAGRTVQGGSTLTQQLAKNLFLSTERTLWRKLREAYIALIIDHRYSKDRILEAYLNEVYLGQNGSDEIHGFALGARLYFGRPIQELRIDQLALLVGVVKGPSYYNPWRYPERAQKRRDLVLKIMLENTLLSASEYEQAVTRPLDIQSKAKIASRQPAYFQQLKRELKAKVGDAFSPTLGLRVFTTLDPVSQQFLEQTIHHDVPKIDRTGKLEAAGVIADRQSGEIRAMVGGVDASYAGFNRATDAKRQIGSLSKPAVYLAAWREPKRFDLATPIADKPITLRSEDGKTWQPRNYDRKYREEVPAYQALAKSLNVPTVNLGMAVGLDKVIDTMVLLGVPANEIPKLPSILLGSLTLSPYQVTQMFQTIGNSGRYAELTALRAVSTQDGQQLYHFIPRSRQVVAEQAAWLTVYGMKQVVAQGTARALQGEFGKAQLAGKTGTTDNNRDSWFVGIDGREVVTIWLGRDDNQSTNLTGSSGALKVYRQYLKRRIPERLQLSWPSEIRTLPYSWQQDHKRLVFDCDGEVMVPVWDVDQAKTKACEKAKNEKSWVDQIFAW
ncbi:Penicillin-binding protein 1B [Vibrio stylophorae]|uniref:Penicillin-binding protein 1B n=1 Tax=Vibrio stylophorae TaxID=659351 RepID=A0ABN8DNA8_9VIBR|nr:penicillin-binding protein 1B [Vibrio stylophorae]CAH0532629.1 Penicillin-binding protein 1B [Vibrio stylophorae]